MIFIPKKLNNESADNYIPCLFYRNPKSPNYLIFFHGNSEHIFQIEYFGLDFRSILEMNVILVEYPGYSIYIDNEPSPEKIYKDSLIIYDWINKTLKVSDNQIFVCGRSLGTSPAIYLASKRNPKSLFLISAFTSIKEIAEDKNLSMFVEKIFESIKLIKDVKCFILLIHGKIDDLISLKHSENLEKEVKNYNKNVELEIRPNMSHNDFDLKEDILNPIQNFLNKNKLKSSDIAVNNSIEETQINELFKIPKSICKLIDLKISNNSNSSNDGRILENYSKISINDENESLIVLDNEIIKNEKKIISPSLFTINSSSNSSISSAFPVKNLIAKLNSKSIITCVLGLSSMNFLSSQVNKMCHASLLLLDVESQDLEVGNQKIIPGILIEYGRYLPNMSSNEEKYTQKGLVKYHYGKEGGLRYYVKDYFEFKNKFCDKGYVILIINANKQKTFSRFIDECAPVKDKKWLNSNYSLFKQDCQTFCADAIDILKPIYNPLLIHLGPFSHEQKINACEKIIPDSILNILKKNK